MDTNCQLCGSCRAVTAVIESNIERICKFAGFTFSAHRLCIDCNKKVRDSSKLIEKMADNPPNPSNSRCLKCFAPTRSTKVPSRVTQLALRLFEYEYSDGEICKDCSQEMLDLMKLIIEIETLNDRGSK